MARWRGGSSRTAARSTARSPTRSAGLAVPGSGGSARAPAETQVAGVDEEPADVGAGIVGAAHPPPCRVGGGQGGLRDVLGQPAVPGQAVGQPYQGRPAARHELAAFFRGPGHPSFPPPYPESRAGVSHHIRAPQAGQALHAGRDPVRAIVEPARAPLSAREDFLTRRRRQAVRTHQGLFAGIFGRGGVDTGDEAWLQALLDTEAALARALERAGLAEPGAGATVTAAAQAEAFDAAGLGRQAALTGNPVPALVRELTRMVPPDAAGAVHKGATSQDIIDTAAMLLARQALSAIAADLSAAASAAAVLAATHRDTLMIGRTLLQQAVPVTSGLAAAGWLTSRDDAREAVARVRAERLAVQLGGAAGTLASLGGDGQRVAGLLADELGLARPVLPWDPERLRALG